MKEKPWSTTLADRRHDRNWGAFALFLGLVVTCALPLKASVLFEDDFNLTGWTVVQPVGAYVDGPLLWEYDVTIGAFVERSNIYTDAATYSPTAIAPMLINDTVSGASFAYTARLTTGDDDGFGLIFGYQNPTNFYRVTFARQSRSGGFPWHAWVVDRNMNGTVTKMFGYGTPGYSQTFVNVVNVPFDVGINVDAANNLTLRVTNNPTGTPTTYTLVNAQPLPAPAGGRVGIFTWGMGSFSGTFAGFRIQNLNLTPASLTGNLSTWTSVIPPRMATNNAAISGQPSWRLTAGQSGPSGVLEETGNCFGGNDVPGQVDFTGATLVTGSDTWSNYVVAARITPNDDDGHGIVFRYRNVTNFYRIVLRAEVTTNGPPVGLSIQKNVNQIYSQIYRDNSVKYVPVAGVPYDLVAQIASNTLNVFVVADPDGAAQVYNYGPFTISGVNTGKVGLISWGMSRT